MVLTTIRELEAYRTLYDEGLREVAYYKQTIMRQSKEIEELKSRNEKIALEAKEKYEQENVEA